MSISTLAPREGSDAALPSLSRARDNFNPRSPRGERPSPVIGSPQWPQFQPSLPARGATFRRLRTSHPGHISTLAPREGSDHGRARRYYRRRDFNPRSPRGERPQEIKDEINAYAISPLAPRAGSDRAGRPVSTWSTQFQPSLPARGATKPWRNRKTGSLFQPSLPARGATASRNRKLQKPWDFNPRSPRGERPTFTGGTCFLFYFNPRSPRGERRALGVTTDWLVGISTLAPREGSDTMKTA